MNKAVMVFGWGKKKQEGSQLPTKSIISLNEIKSLLSAHQEEKKKQVVQKSKPLFSAIQNELGAIYKIIDHLKNDTLKVEDIEKILQVIVVRAKTEVIDVISKESKKPTPSVSTYDDLLKASDSASHTLKKIGDVLGKNSRVIHVFAKKYAQDLKDHLAVVTQNHAYLVNLIREYSAVESSTDSINDMVAKMHDLTQDLQSTSRHIITLQESYDTAQKLYNSTQKQISDLRSSPAYLAHLDAEKQVQQILTQEASLNKEIDDEFSKVSRPLGKYVYVASLDKQLKLVLERLVERPSSVVGTESKDSIVTILESCMKGIVSGTVSVKESDKSVDQINHIISVLDSLISKKDNVASRIAEVQKSQGFDTKIIELLEKQVAKAKSDSDDAQTKIKALEFELAQKTTQKEKLFQDIQSHLEKTLGAKYEVTHE